jgi:hypothetical protein
VEQKGPDMPVEEGTPAEAAGAAEDAQAMQNEQMNKSAASTIVENVYNTIFEGENLEKNASFDVIDFGERISYITKVGAVAEEMLEAEYDDSYDEEDVEKLAVALIALEVEAAEEQEKMAEHITAGRVMADAMVERLLEYQSE